MTSTDNDWMVSTHIPPPPPSPSRPPSTLHSCVLVAILWHRHWASGHRTLLVGWRCQGFQSVIWRWSDYHLLCNVLVPACCMEGCGEGVGWGGVGWGGPWIIGLHQFRWSAPTCCKPALSRQPLKSTSQPWIEKHARSVQWACGLRWKLRSWGFVVHARQRLVGCGA